MKQMKKKRLDGLLALLLVVISVVFSALPVQAAESEVILEQTVIEFVQSDQDQAEYEDDEFIGIMPYYTNIRSVSASISSSGSTIYSAGTGSKYPTVSGGIKISVTLQKKVNGVWSAYDSGSKTLDSVTTSGTYTLTTTKVTSGSYRAKVTVTVSGESGSATSSERSI